MGGPVAQQLSNVLSQTIYLWTKLGIFLLSAGHGGYSMRADRADRDAFLGS